MAIDAHAHYVPRQILETLEREGSRMVAGCCLGSWGRFDMMHVRMERSDQQWSAVQAPSAYLRRFWYDTVLHDGAALRYLADKISLERVGLGSGDPFPPMHRQPLVTSRAAGFDATATELAAERNPRQLFGL